jgi:hypothetical protein
MTGSRTYVEGAFLVESPSRNGSSPPHSKPQLQNGVSWDDHAAAVAGRLAHSSTARGRSAALVGCPTRTLASPLVLSLADDLIPGTRSFRVGLRPGGGGRVKLDHGLRFLVGQPHDQAVRADNIGQRILLVFRQGLHL